jgi:nicotinamidase-related amidase
MRARASLALNRLQARWIAAEYIREMARALVIIDIQRDYFPGGAYPLVAPDAAALVAHGVLERARVNGERVIHVRHIAQDAGATFFLPGTVGGEIHELVAPEGDEPVVIKAEPNSFIGTDLQARLDGIDDLVIVGMMSSMCVDATSRAALDLGFAVTVVHDACAAPDLEFGGETVPGDVVHRAFMAALRDAGANVVAAAEHPAPALG